jgi:protein gp37
MGDIFHQNADPEWQKILFGCMALSPQNFYYLLTKRTAIAADFFRSLNILECIDLVAKHPVLNPYVSSNRLDLAFLFYQREREVMGQYYAQDQAQFIGDWNKDVLRNTIIGASCGVQSCVEDRVFPLFTIRDLGWQTWISAEPLIEAIDFRFNPNWGRTVDWLVLGGESTQGKLKGREFQLEWAESVLLQCRKAGVNFWLKQLGSKPTLNRNSFTVLRQGEILTEAPIHLQVRERPITSFMFHKAMVDRFRSLTKERA